MHKSDYEVYNNFITALREHDYKRIKSLAKNNTQIKCFTDELSMYRNINEDDYQDILDKTFITQVEKVKPFEKNCIDLLLNLGISLKTRLNALSIATNKYDFYILHLLLRYKDIYNGDLYNFFKILLLNNKEKYIIDTFQKLSNIPDIDYNNLYKIGNKLLMLAIYNGNIKLVKYLVNDLNVNVNKPREFSLLTIPISPMELAYQSKKSKNKITSDENYNEIIRILRSAGAHKISLWKKFVLSLYYLF